MKIRDIRCGWTAEGERVATLPAHQPTNEAALQLYYGLKPDTKSYADYQRPVPWDRAVLRKDNGSFVIVPLNPDYFEVV